jgi:hypothetical protein
MKSSILTLGLCILAAGTMDACGQGGPLMGMGSGPRFDGHMAKLFGTQQNFVCDLDVEATPSDRPDGVSMPARLSYADGKSRLEMDLTRIKGAMMPAGMMEQVKAMGMANMVIISRPDTGVNSIVYPGLKSYASLPAEKPKTPKADDFKVVTKELGKEKLDGQDCVKNQVTVTGADGKKFEATVWNATQLKQFPVRIRSSEGGTPYSLTFRNVKFEKPAATLFETPASFTRYDDPMALMRGAAMKLQGGGAPAAK